MRTTGKIIGGFVMAWLLVITGVSIAQNRFAPPGSSGNFNSGAGPGITGRIPLSVQDIYSLRTLTDTQLQILIETLAASPTVPCVDLPWQGLRGNFFSLQHPEWPPLPLNSSQSEVWTMDDAFLMSDLNYDYDAPGKNPLGKASKSSNLLLGKDGDNESSNWYQWDTNQLWLEITNVANGLAYLNLHNATNQIYAIWATTNLGKPFADWPVATEIWPADTNCQPFTLPMLDRDNLFVRAEDWTGKDSNGDGVPDWWAWKYFGSVNVAVADLDSGGTNTIGYDYTNGFDPNVVYFTVSATNLYANHTTVPLQLNLASGVPSYYAVLVNDTNYSHAVWHPYVGTNFMATLGTTNGNYEVWVGLRGRPEDATVTWDTDDITFTLDRVAPMVTITSPTLVSGSAVVGKPYLQLQGFATKILSRVSYDISNAVNVTSGLAGQVTDVAGYDPASGDYRTNYFQCFDLPLATNLNRITVYVSDRAGNSSTNTFNVVLDYLAVTNPPAVKLFWPTDGMAICGDHFTIRGTMSDETGSIVAQIIDGDGNTNTFPGLVERNNVFWVENVPLNGESEITIQATSSAGQTTTTNIVVTTNSLALTINDTPNDLYQPVGHVDGTVGDANAIVMVNGQVATVDDTWQNGDGTYNWRAENVPIYGMGTASFDASASMAADFITPNTRALQGQVWNINNIVGLSANLSKAVEMPATVEMTHYHYAQACSDNIDDGPHHWSLTRDYDKQFIRDNDGQWRQVYQATEIIVDSWGTGRTTNTWTDPQPFALGEFIPTDILVDTSGGVRIGTQHNFGKNVHHRWDYGGGYYAALALTADSRYTVITGGNSADVPQSLFKINVTGSATGRSQTGPVAWGTFWFQAPLVELAAQAFEVLAGKLGNDGICWAMLPQNSLVNLGLETPAPNDTEAQPAITPIPMFITANGTRLDPKTVTNAAQFCVGQNVRFELNGLPTDGSVFATNFQWKFAGIYFNAVSNAVPELGWPTCSTVPYVNGSLLTSNSATAWWVSGGTNGNANTPAVYTASISCDLIFTNGNLSQHISDVKGLFNMFRPRATVTTKTGTIGIDANYFLFTNIVTGGLTNNVPSPNVFGLHFGISSFPYGTNSTNGAPGIVFSNSVIYPSNFLGQVKWAQVVNYALNKIRHASNPNYAWDSPPVLDIEIPMLDSTYPYPSDLGNPTTEDSPAQSVALQSDYSGISCDQQFSMWLMFRADAGSHDVPLCKVDWSWSALAALSLSGTNWDLVAPTNTVNPIGRDTTIYPYWTANADLMKRQ